MELAETFNEEMEEVMTSLQSCASERIEMRAHECGVGKEGPGLTAVKPPMIWTSPATRCRVLADKLQRRLGISEIRVDDRLAELHFGLWEGCRWDDLRGGAVDAWMRDPWNMRPPGGEAAWELWERVKAFRDERRAEMACARGVSEALKNTLIKSDEVSWISGDGIVITHAGVIRAWRSLAENRPWQELFAEKIALGSVWTVDMDDVGLIKGRRSKQR